MKNMNTQRLNDFHKADAGGAGKQASQELLATQAWEGISSVGLGPLFSPSSHVKAGLGSSHLQLQSGVGETVESLGPSARPMGPTQCNSGLMRNCL